MRYSVACVTFLLLCGTAAAHHHHRHHTPAHVDDTTPIAPRSVPTVKVRTATPADIVARNFPHLYNVQYVDVVFMTAFPPYAGKWRE